MKKYLAALLLAALASHAVADPAFDRPGTAFNPSVLAPGSLAWEQGLPDMTRDTADHVSTTLLEYDSRLRVGVAPHVELQLYGDPYAHLSVTGESAVGGAGNSGAAVKVNLPTHSDALQIGLMAALDFNSGNAAFRDYDNNGRPARSAYFGVTGSWNLNASQSVALYGDVTRTGKDDLYTVSPSWSIVLNDSVGAYLEYRVTFGDQPFNDNLAGGGFTWMLTHKLQFDIYSDFGLTPASTDYEAGIGLSYLLR